ncbi:ethanolaminephosphotransferase 1-like [Liolophura sinensis]|uniref:ethanolaminephosphotransferase 1-like n=1 Tax=Liolophura sinensis TaxID=3198878 RepID=UPI0031582DB3
MAVFYYLSPGVLRGFGRYKYSAIDTSPVSNYITHPFWNWVVEFVPRWIAPNVLTLMGFLLLLVNFSLTTYYDPHFYAASRDHLESPPIPNWVWLLCAINNFLSHTLDGIDGKQARRTKSSSPLGELFDHGLDSWATLFFPVGMYSVFGRAEGGVGVFRVYSILLGVMLCFSLSHWEKYNTGVLYLPWGYDISQIGMTIVYLITYLGTYKIWKFALPIINLQSAEAFEILCYVGFLGLTIPPTFWNIYVSYRDKTGKMRSFYEAMRPLFSVILLFTLMIVWAFFSKADILENQPRLFYWVTGTVFSNITCHLIVAQMSDTRCELLNVLLVPLLIIVLAVIVLPLQALELQLLWAYAVLTTTLHVHYGVNVVKEMCSHFSINAFTLKKAE